MPPLPQEVQVRWRYSVPFAWAVWRVLRGSAVAE